MWLQKEFGPFQLRELLGRGEMSVTFRAFDPQRGIEVALKILRPPAAALPPDVAAFVAAVRRLQAVGHPRCARVYAVGVEESHPYVAMEYLPGPSLAGRLAAERRLSEVETLDIGCQAAEALGAAHEAGLPHRDFQPRRIRFAADGSVRVTGFAESIFLDCASMDVGIIRGRLSYVAPERLCGLLEDVRSEIFTLGATLFETLTGQKPHEGEPHGEILRDLHVTETLRIETLGHTLHPATAAVLNRMLNVDLGDRPQSWREAATALRTARIAIPDAPPLPPSARPLPVPHRKAMVAALAALVILVGILSWTHWRQTRVAQTPEQAQVPPLVEERIPLRP